MPRIKNVKFTDAALLLREGDVLLFRGRGLVSFFIRRSSVGLYTHVGVASCYGVDPNVLWECVEFREWKGGRTVNLERYVKNNPGVIDVYRPITTRSIYNYDQDLNKVIEMVIAFNGLAVTNIMRRMTGLPYGWNRIWWIAQQKIPVLRAFYSMDSVIDDTVQEEVVYPVCSTAVAHAFSKVGYDLLNNRSDESTEPSDIGKSPLVNYIFTLIP